MGAEALSMPVEARSPVGEWWRDELVLTRFVSDLVASELAHLRPGQAVIQPPAWPAGMELGTGGLGLDSLELVTIATALTQTLHLHRSGIEDYLLARRRLGDWVTIAAKGLSIHSDRVTFHTSGSTGTPKACCHDLEALVREVAVHARNLGSFRRVIGLVPSHHIYGFLFTILLPRQLGAQFMDGRGRLPGRVVADLGPGDLLVGVPEQWAALSRSGAAIPPGVTGICSTGPMDPDLYQRLIDQGLCLIEVYGSSETGGIGWRRSPLQPFHLLDTLSLSSDGTSLDRGWDGNKVMLQDRLAISDPGTCPSSFRLAGRKDGAIQIGGINIFPDQVAAALRSHPAVAAASVRPMPVPGGIRLKAFIVPDVNADTDTLVAALTAWADEHLRPQERPRSWTLGAALPTTPMGKQADW